VGCLACPAAATAAAMAQATAMTQHNQFNIHSVQRHKLFLIHHRIEVNKQQTGIFF